MSEINDETKIYRIFNLYDLVNTLSEDKIRLGQASRMSDKNEMFGIYFDSLRSAFSPFTPESRDKLQNEFHLTQNFHYMSCWTRAPENIAVWSLYSPLGDAIQASTSYGKIKSAINKHYDFFGFAKAHKLEPNDPTDLFMPPYTGPVKYVDFHSEYLSIKEKFKKIDCKMEEWVGEWKGIDCNSHEDYIECFKERYDKLFSEEFGGSERGGPLLKDEKYKHEEEVRFILSMTRRDGRTKEEYESHPFAGLDGPYRHPKPDLCPSNVFVDFDKENFIDFQVDGRIDDYKFKAIESIFLNFGFSVSRNKAFKRIEI